MVSFSVGDVINVLNSCKPQLIALAVIIVMALIVIIACSKVEKRKKALICKEALIAMGLGITIVINLICTGPMRTLLNLVSGDGTISEDSMNNAINANVQMAEEGMVLLKNEDNTLPLKDTKKLNVFGWSSTNPVYSGTGAGSINDNYDKVSILEGLKKAGFEVNQEIADFYVNFKDTRPIIDYWGQDWTVPEPSMDEYDQADIFNKAKAFSDVAVVVLARSGGEGADLPTSYYVEEDTFKASGGGLWGGAEGLRMSEYAEDLDESKTYLEPTTRELQMIDRVAKEFSTVIVVINSANTMELGVLDQYDSVKAAIYTPGAGQAGFTALGKILNGEVNPSGKTADTFVYDLTKTPYFNNIGLFTYENMKQYGHIDDLGLVDMYPSFVNYVENIYVGYKYYETAAKENFIDYDSTVQYPFGYGLSYTTFSQKMGDISEENGIVSFEVTVQNTGDVAGKDVVEVFFDPPYTNGGIEKASANLVEFAKTDMLKPGESQVLTISFSVEDMASFDAKVNKCYVLESGDYTISINSDSHNVIDSRVYTVQNDTVYSEDNARSSDQTAAVTQLEFAEGNAEYLSRADGFANYEKATAAPSDYMLPEQEKEAFLNNSNYDPRDYNDENDEMPVTGAKNGIVLEDLKNVDYDDEKWEQLLDELTVDEMNTLIATGGYQTAAIESIEKSSTVDCDGAAAINNNFTGQGSIGFPSEVMLACTWNKELAATFGDNIGEMADEMGVTGWYAPSMNMHRTAFGGRNFEYYSEDGVLAGKMAAKAVEAAKKHGVYAYIKHFALNDQETNRYGQLCTWSTEQAIREIYLKPFELAVKDGGADAVMSSYNHIGTLPGCACAPLDLTILRDEWGFRGMVLTDYFVDFGFMDSDRAIRNGVDIMLADYDTGTNYLTDTTSATAVKAMRQATKNILYTVVNSRVYEDHTFDRGLDTWQKVLIGVDALVLILFAVAEIRTVQKYRKSDLQNEAEQK
jgi:beta-glucosidase-related glycosidases